MTILITKHCYSVISEKIVRLTITDTLDEEVMRLNALLLAYPVPVAL